MSCRFVTIVGKESGRTSIGYFQPSPRKAFAPIAPTRLHRARVRQRARFAQRARTPRQLKARSQQSTQHAESMRLFRRSWFPDLEILDEWQNLFSPAAD